MTSQETTRELLTRLTGERQELFLHIAEMTAANDVGGLRSLHADPSHQLHVIVDELLGYRDDPDAARVLGAPYRAEQGSPVHALRALAGLGLALVDAAAAPDAIEAALRWLARANGAADAGFTAMTADHPALVRCLGLVWASTAPDRARAAAQVVLARLARAATPVLRSEAVGVLFAFRVGDGQRARLRAMLCPGPPCLVPDPERMSLFAADARFGEALNLAWTKAGAGRLEGTVLYAVETADGPVPYVQDGSLGAAFAVVLDELYLRNRRTGFLRIRRLRSATFVVGALSSGDALASVGGYAQKLRAAGAGRVVFPAADHDAAVEEAHDADLVPARTWKRAASLARRLDRRALVRQVVAATLAVIMVAAGLVWFISRKEQDASWLALARRLATEAAQVASLDPGLAGLLAAEAYRMQATPEIEAALFGALTAVPLLIRDGTEEERRVRRETVPSPDGTLVAVRRARGAVDVVETTSGNMVFTVMEARESDAPFRTALTWSPNGDRLATLDDATGRLRVFDRRGNVLATVRPYELQPYRRARHRSTLEFGPDGQVLFVAGDGSVQPFVTDTLRPLSGRWPRPGTGDGLEGLPFGVSATLERLVACQDGRVMSYDIRAILKGRRTPASRIQKRNLPGVSGGCTGLSLSPNGRFLAVISDTRVALWDMSGEDHRIGTERVFNRSFLTSVHWDSTGDRVLLQGQDRIEAVDLLEITPPRTLPQNEIPGASGTNRVNDVWFDTEDPNLFAVLLEDGRLRWMSWKNRNPLETGRRLPFQGGRPFAVSGDKAAGYGPDGWAITRPGTDLPPVQLETPPTDPSELRFSQDGSVLAAWENTGGATLWDSETGRGLGTVDPGSLAQEFALSPDGRFVATSVGPGSSGGGGYITLWSVDDGQVAEVRTSDGIAQSGMTFTDKELIFNDGPRLIAWRTSRVSPGDDRTHPLGDVPIGLAADENVLYVAMIGSVRALDVGTWRQENDPLSINTSEMQIENGWLINRPSRDSDREVWNLGTGQRMGVLPTVDEADLMTPWAFSGDHKTAYAATTLGVKALAWDPEGWIRLACARAARALTPAEWRRFLNPRPYKPVCR
ncbi:WD40 repeat domain-containing protein [Nonomuraea cavernae]|uniref:WD40 repeat domain-containing protein n=1 Tax=Nonomuraea cavernae TaxID=2045107 RepID=UPI0033F3A0F8